MKPVLVFSLLCACSSALWSVSPATPAVCDSRPINPVIAFTVAIPDAGPMIFDGTYLWVASSNLLTAINPATGAVVASQSIPGTQFMAYDGPSGTLWLEGGSQNAQLNKVNAQQIIANNGSASVDSIAFSSALPTGLALDSNASARNVWAVAGGVATIINMGSLEVVNTVATPDGYPITQINQAYSLGGMMLSTSSIVGNQPVANVWFYGHDGEVIWESPFSQFALSPGVWDGYANTELSAEAVDGTLYEYMFPSGGTSNVTRSTLQLTDAADNGLPQIGGVSGLAVSVPDGLILAARQEVDVPNQVYFISVRCGPGAHEVPGVTVPGAVLTAFGGGFAWASSPGPSGGVTAMAY